VRPVSWRTTLVLRTNGDAELSVSFMSDILASVRPEGRLCPQ
jgi:hypothetical protein